MKFWLALLVVAAQADPQDLEVNLSASVFPDTVTVGEPFALTVVVDGLDGARVEFPAMPDTGAVISRQPPTVQGDDPSTRTAVYSMVAWRVGELRVPDGQVVLLRGGEEVEIPLPGAGVYVRSVLPADADPDTLAYQPGRGALGPNWSLAEKLGGGALALALIFAVAIYLRKRSRAAQVIAAPPPRPPRERALEALDRLAQSGLIESGEFKAFYSKLGQILREFIALEHPAWGVDLTSSELLAAARGDDFDHIQLEGLRQLLNEADLVKFARRRTPRGRAGQDLEATRRWITAFRRPPPPPPPPVVEEEVAAEAADGEEAALDAESFEVEGEDVTVRDIEKIFEDGDQGVTTEAAGDSSGDEPGSEAEKES